MQKRVAVFAHYDADSVVDPYVVYYLRSLMGVCDRIVVVSDCDLPAGEVAKLEAVADKVIASVHGEYDFGSYKRGFAFARQQGWMEDASQLVLANDSCYGPLTDLDELFAEMDAVGADAWGLASNSFGIYKGDRPWHIQSFFCVYNRNIFIHEGFIALLDSVTAQKDKNDVITLYEIGLSKWMLGSGFKVASYTGDILADTSNPFYWHWKEIFRQKPLPLIKVALVGCTALGQWRRIVSRTSYPFELIQAHRARTGLFTFRSRTGGSVPLGVKFKAVRRYVLRIHRKRGRFCIFGVWYNYKRK